MDRKWKKTSGWNYVNIRKGFYLSYNPITLDFTRPPGETAICIGKIPNKNFFILNGDFRKQYDKCETLADCLKFFIKNESEVSIFSDSKEDAEKILIE